MNLRIEFLYSYFEEHPQVCTDTRKIEEGAIFFALRGDQFDGNKFAEEALNKGCSLAVIDDAKYRKDSRYFLVNDVLTTLQLLANFHRQHLEIPIIAITGSNGKTTTKELVSAVLSKKFKTLATKGNLNNHIGVPLTVLSITKEHEMAVIEMGANHLEEIHRLCQIALPNYGLITNIGKAHLEGFGSIKNIIEAKTELYQHLHKYGGTAFVNKDDATLMKHASLLVHCAYGKSEAQCIGEITANDPYISLRWKNFENKNPIENQEIVSTQLIGNYNFNNILSAICIGDYFEVDENDINEAIRSYVPSNNRSQVIKKNGNTILMDAYNANPTSMKAALENFIEMNGDNKVLILGDMLELGAASKEEHQNIVQLIEENHFAQVLLVGQLFSETKNLAQCFPSNIEAIEWLKGKPIEKAHILIKGSRGIRLEKIVEEAL